jgi:hypothetical protein
MSDSDANKNKAYLKIRYINQELQTGVYKILEERDGAKPAVEKM